MAVERALDGRGEAAQHRVVRGEVGLAACRPHAEQRERREQPARAGVADQLAQEGLRRDELVGQRRELRRVEIEQPLLGEEGRGVRPGDGAEVGGVRRQLLGERRRRRCRLLGLGGIDHHHQQIAELGKVLGEARLGLAEGEMAREHLVGVGADAEMARRVEAGQQGHQDAGGNDEKRAAATGVHHAHEQGLERHAGCVLEPRDGPVHRDTLARPKGGPIPCRNPRPRPSAPITSVACSARASSPRRAPRAKPDISRRES